MYCDEDQRLNSINDNVMTRCCCRQQAACRDMIIYLLKFSNRHSRNLSLHFDIRLLHDITKLLHGIHHEIFTCCLVF